MYSHKGPGEETQVSGLDISAKRSFFNAEFCDSSPWLQIIITNNQVALVRMVLQTTFLFMWSLPSQKERRKKHTHKISPCSLSHYIPRKLTWQLKIHHLKMHFLLNMGIFQPVMWSLSGVYIPLKLSILRLHTSTLFPGFTPTQRGTTGYNGVGHTTLPRQAAELGHPRLISLPR